MKKSLILMMVVAMLSTTSCSMLGGASSGNSTASSAGSTTGLALSHLYKSKKAGTLSITNASDLTNILAVINGYNSLKANKDNANYKSAFGAGLIAGGAGLITSTNSTSIMNALLNSSALSGVSSTNIVSKATTVLGALNVILALLGN